MTMTMATTPMTRPAPMHEGDDAFVPMAAELAETFAPRAAAYDRDNAFAAENFADLTAAGYLRLAVPEALGGFGASMRQAIYAQAELARGCASTALAVNMHVFMTLVQTYRWRKGAPGAEGLLRRVVTEDLVLLSTGGSDGPWPSATAERVEGGFRVSGRKIFGSLAPVADVMSTSAVFDDPESGPIVLALGIPLTSDGVRIDPNWDAMGMRATGSHDIVLDNVFVRDAQVSGRRPLGRVDATLRAAGIHFAPLVASVYYGLAAAARDEAVRPLWKRRGANGEPLACDPLVQRQVGMMDSSLMTAWWVLSGAVDQLGVDYGLEEQTMSRLMIAKREVVRSAIAVVDQAMEVAGGAAYLKRSPLERAFRDVRAALFHPHTPERTLIAAGRLGLGLPADEIW